MWITLGILSKNVENFYHKNYTIPLFEIKTAKKRLFLQIFAAKTGSGKV